MTTEKLAAEVGRQATTVTFQVSNHFLDEVLQQEWSETVQFRFEQDEFGRWDLVMRRVETE